LLVSLVLVLLGLLLSTSTAHAATTCYVNDNAAGANNGNSWTDAYTSLQSALADANCTEIWVAAGIYKPGTNRSDTFQLKSGVAVYGGFAGTETLLGQRDWATNKTILSGDIDNNDMADPSGVVTNTAGITGSNSFHVVVANNVDSSAVLDGFIITAGKADGSNPDYRGGGLYLTNSHPALRNLILSGNWAYGPGGGMYLDFSSPTLANVAFAGNSAYDGGGMFNFFSSPTLTHVSFAGNAASNAGGGMFNDSSSNPTLRNAILWANIATNVPSIYNDNSTPSIAYSNVQGCFVGSTWNTACGADGGGNIHADPLFADAANGNLRLRPGSPAIDAGNVLFVPAGLTADLDGKPRIWDGDGSGTAGVDMGAYETRVLYAAPAAQNSGSCVVWSHACTLQTALGVARYGDQIWVKAGVHKPTANPADRSASFALKSGVQVYGGFAGTETLLGQRDWATYKTILSGDIDGNDTADASGVVTSTAGITGTNSFHVVRADNVDSSTLLDGFIITAGKADGVAYYAYDRGGGVYLNASRLTLRNLILSGNAATNGGGMFNWNSSPTLTNVAFAGNSATDGGGMFNIISSSPTLTNVAFAGNSAYNAGGGMFNRNSHPTLVNVAFAGNSASNAGGGMLNESFSHPTLTNVAFAGNSASNAGGGMWNSDSKPKLRNAILWGNTATNGPSIYNFGSNAPTIAYSLLQDSSCPGNCSGGGMIYNADPLFVDADGPDNIPGTLDDNLRLRPGSPAIDAGNNAFLPAGLTTDLAGRPRIQDGDSNGSAIVDMGAYETPPNQPPVADAGLDQSVSVGQLVTLNGSGSSDPDNHLPLSYAWTQSGGPSVTLSGANTATPSFTPTAVGVYTFTLVVTDSAGLASAPDQVVITVTNQPLLQLYLPVVMR
jgi:hypothetical protein